MRGGELRRSLLAPPGYRLVVADSAQIEARTLAWLSGEHAIIEAFANKRDVYKMMASAIYNVSEDQVDKEQRFVGKVCVLGLGYGMGGSKLNDTLAKGAMGPKVVLPTEETTRIVAAYRAANKSIVSMWRRAEEILIDMILGNTGSYGPFTWGKGHIKMPNGLFMQYANLSGEIRYDRSGRARLSDAWYEGKRGVKTYIYGGSATENWVQSLARCIVAGQMLAVSERYRVVTMAHDEIVCLAKEDEADECLRFMIEAMSTAPPWAEGLPLAAEGGHDVCYSK
jgi:DNA polymerase